ncbi:MAG: hypothetical protein ACW99A_21710, partial [Candidatus Kariarchaeaceae archaeon]
DNMGNEIWNKTCSNGMANKARSIIHSSDNNYVIAGMTYTSTEWDLWMIKLDNNGEVLWNTTYGGSDIDEPRSISQTSDRGFIIGGYTESFGVQKKDIWVIKTNPNGEVLWNTTFGSIGEDGIYISRSIIQLNNDSYILVGTTRPSGGNSDDVMVIKFRNPEEIISITSTTTSINSITSTTISNFPTTTTTTSNFYGFSVITLILFLGLKRKKKI